MRRLDLISSLIIVGLAGFALIWLIPNHVPTRHDPGDLPPNLMPLLSAGALGLAGLLLGISAWRKKEKDFDAAKMNEAAETMGFGLTELKNLGVILAASGVYWLIMKYAGFEVASAILIAAGMWFGGLRKIWLMAALAIVVPVLVSKIAWYTLNIKLP